MLCCCFAVVRTLAPCGTCAFSLCFADRITSTTLFGHTQRSQIMKESHPPNLLPVRWWFTNLSAAAFAQKCKPMKSNNLAWLRRAEFSQIVVWHHQNDSRKSNMGKIRLFGADPKMSDIHSLKYLLALTSHTSFSHAIYAQEPRMRASTDIILLEWCNTEQPLTFSPPKLLQPSTHKHSNCLHDGMKM